MQRYCLRIKLNQIINCNKINKFSTSCKKNNINERNNINYDGTIQSLGKSDIGKDALDDNIETVKLAFDKHSPPNNSTIPLNPIPNIIFLHGLFGSKSNNRSISRQLSKLLNCDIYCVDLRNHGDSPHNKRHDYPSMAADIERFIKDNQIIKPILIGHSMGAKCAMAVTLRKPKLCSGLISVDNAPVNFTGGSTGFSKFGKYIKSLKEIELTPNLKTIKDCDLILSKVEKNLQIRQFLETNLRKDKFRNNEFFKSRVPLDIMINQIDNISSWPFNNEISRWNGKSLFIRGLKSAYVADDFLQAIGLFFPNFEIVDIDAGHWVISEKPREFINAVNRWIDVEFE